MACGGVASAFSRHIGTGRQFGMSEIDHEAIVIAMARPTNGNPMPGTGGARKVRFSGRALAAAVVIKLG
jgi:hypothetical protein